MILDRLKNAGFALGLLAAAAAATAGTATTTDRLIIKYRDGSSAASNPSTQTMSAAYEAANRMGVQMSRVRANAFGSQVMKMDRTVSVETARQMASAIAAADADIEYAEPDLMLTKMLVPNDTSYTAQWHYYESTAGINLPAAWDKSTGSGVVVAVVDTGYRPHADLAANIVGGYDFISTTAVSNDGDGRDSSALDPGDAVSANECGSGESAESSSWHGTHVAGTIAAVTNNSTGVAGVAYGAKVLPVRVLGKCGGYTSDIADGIVWAAGGTVSGVTTNAYPAKVINISLGGTASCGTTMQNAVTSARSKGAVVVVAAGNSAADVSTSMPANCTGVIAVAAVDRSGGRTYYSNYGSGVTLAAPGGDMRSSSANGILSTLNSGSSSPGSDSYAYYAGTSMATPHVAGVAALMLAANSSLTPDVVASLLKSSAKAFPASCSGCGAGIVDAGAAVTAALAYTGSSSGDSGSSSSSVSETESNNTLATAQSLSGSSVTVSGSLSSSSDTDYFKISVAAGGTLTVTLTPSSTTGNPDLAIYNSAGKLVSSSAKAKGVAETLAVKNSGSSAATAVVRVLRGSGAGSASIGYTLLLKQ